MATGFTKFGNLSLGGDSAGAGIGGTAAAGDWLVMTFVAIDGDPTSVAPGDNIGGVYTLLGSYAGLDGYTLFCYAKKCTGGENGAGGTWAGATNGAMVGVWIQAPTQPEVYVIDQGVATYDPGVENAFQTANAPSTDAESYLGINGNGRQPLLGGGIRPDQTSGGFEISPGNVSCVAAWNANEGTNTTADRPTQYDSATSDLDMYCLILGIRESPSDVELESTGGLVGGDADLTADAGGTALESVGGLVGGSSTLTTGGGDAPLASLGGLVGGQAHLSSPEPFPPVPNTPPLLGFLGCGVYDVYIFTRGLHEIVGRIPFNELTWQRILDDTSTAEVTVDGVSNVGSMRDCCQLLGSIMPYKHEIGLYRNGRRVWSGPVTKVSYPSETVVIDAADLSYWLSDRELHDNHNDVQQDLADIWAEYVADAMSVDNSPGLYATVQAPTGVLADRLYTPDMGTVAADAIAELARTGLDWTCTDRRMVGGPVQQQPAPYPDAEPIPTLIDESFREAPTVERDGAAMANCWFVGGSGSGPGGAAIFGEYGPEFPATPDHIAQPAAPDYAAIEDEFGRIEARVNETKILDQPSIDQNAATRYDLTKRPVDVISSGTLLPSAGIDISQLTAGSLQNIHLTRACVQIGAPYRLKQLNVTAANDGSEDVEGVWEPIGSVAAHEDLG